MAHQESAPPTSPESHLLAPLHARSFVTPADGLVSLGTHSQRWGVGGGLLTFLSELRIEVGRKITRLSRTSAGVGLVY